jgi:hypothetical protein
MPELPTYFIDFLAEIRLTPEQVAELKSAHEILRERLAKDTVLAKLVVTAFLQGSYRRATIVQPPAGEKADVDVVVVTRLDRDRTTPHQALSTFRDFLDRHYPGRWAYQGRSIGIELDRVALDLVVTSAPSEVAQKMLVSESVRSAATPEDAPNWRLNASWRPPEQRHLPAYESLMRKALQDEEWAPDPLWIPDRDARCWQQTHPLAQLRWTVAKNASTNRHFVNVVKALKWWRRVRHPRATEPLSYPLERILGECCPDGVTSVAGGIAATLEGIRDHQSFRSAVAAGRRPVLADYGTGQDVLASLSDAGFVGFYRDVEAAAAVAREALEEKSIPAGAKRWRDLFGDRFPEGPDQDGGAGGRAGGSAAGGGFTARREPSVPRPERFA